MCNKDGCEIDYGYCHCGCGAKTTVPEHSNPQENRVPGVPVRFRQGHNSRVKHPNVGRKYRVRSSGYVKLNRPDHPRASDSGYVFEHVYVASEAMGRPVPKDAEVHHVNGDKSDNRPENLVVCSRSYHKLLHRRTKALRATGDPDALRCWLCQEWDTDPDMTLASSGSAYHKECAARYARLKRRLGAQRAREEIRADVA